MIRVDFAAAVAPAVPGWRCASVTAICTLVLAACSAVPASGQPAPTTQPAPPTQPTQLTPPTPTTPTTPTTQLAPPTQLAPLTPPTQLTPAVPGVAPPKAPVAAAAMGAAWVRLSAPGGDELWYDREQLVFSANDITFWRRVNFVTPQQFMGSQIRSAMYREQINCDEHTLRVHAQVFISVEGAMVDRVNHSTPEALAIVPDTLGATLSRALCPMIAQRRMSEERIRIAQDRLDNRRRDLDRLRGEVEELELSLGRLRAESRDPGRDLMRDAVRDGVRDTPRDVQRQPGKQGL